MDLSDEDEGASKKKQMPRYDDRILLIKVGRPNLNISIVGTQSNNP